MLDGDVLVRGWRCTEMFRQHKLQCQLKMCRVICAPGSSGRRAIKRNNCIVE